MRSRASRSQTHKGQHVCVRVKSRSGPRHVGKRKRKKDQIRLTISPIKFSSSGARPPEELLTLNMIGKSGDLPVLATSVLTSSVLEVTSEVTTVEQEVTSVVTFEVKMDVRCNTDVTDVRRRLPPKTIRKNTK